MDISGQQVRVLAEEILCSRMSVSLPSPLVTGSGLGPPRPFLLALDVQDVPICVRT